MTTPTAWSPVLKPEVHDPASSFTEQVPAVRTFVSGEQNGVAVRVGRTLLNKVSDHAQTEPLWKFNAKYDPKWRPRYFVLDSVEFILTQGLVMAGAQGVNKIPVIGRYLGSSGR